MLKSNGVIPSYTLRLQQPMLLGIKRLMSQQYVRGSLIRYHKKNNGETLGDKHFCYAYNKAVLRWISGTEPIFRHLRTRASVLIA